MVSRIAAILSPETSAAQGFGSCSGHQKSGKSQVPKSPSPSFTIRQED